MSIHSSSTSGSIQRQDVTTSTNFLHPDFKSVRELEEEVVLFFYNSMLDLTVREWIHVDDDEDVNEVSAQKPEAQPKVKSFKELTKEDLETHEVTSVKGSKVSLIKKSGKRSSSALITKSKTSKMTKSISSRLSKSGRKRSTLDEQTSFSLELGESSDQFEWLVETSPEKVVIAFRNGNIYRGPVQRKRFHGRGTFIWADGTIYEGDFAEGQITGKGKLYYKDCSYYIGEFCKGLLHGQGCMYITPTNTMYSGEWKRGKKNGRGWLFYGPDHWDEGEWVDDKQHGDGIHRYDKTSMYQGNWQHGVREGYGTMVWSNRDFYCGEWKDGTMHGYGEYIWKAFFNKTFAFPIVNKFEGNWEEGTRTGEGVLDFGFYGGAKMAGYWVRNMKHGPALVICGNGKTMAGNPLFLYDKPVDIGNWYGNNSNLSIPSVISTSDKLSFIKNMSNTASNDASHKTISLSAFPKVMSNHINPLCIPVHYEPRQVDLSYYLRLFIKKHNLIESSIIFDPLSQDIFSIEETKLRNVIISNNVPLKNIYYQYAFIATNKEPLFRPVMIRLFLWQLYFDLDISTRGISLIDTDLCLIENPDCGLETQHDPFERIYFWQFLQSLVAVAWKLYGDVIEMDAVEGTLAKILRKFLYDDVLPNVGKMRGTALREYKNLLPIQSVYMLYRSIGDPPTARILYKSFITKGYPLCSEKIFEGDDIKNLQPGSNVTAIGTAILFLPDEQKVGSKVHDRTPYPFKTDNAVLRNLHIFSKMKRSKLIDSIAEICPPVVTNGVIVNMDYPISFLEFYNIILLITCTKIDDLLNRGKPKAEQAKASTDQKVVENTSKVSKKNLAKDKKDKKGK